MRHYTTSIILYLFCLGLLTGSNSLHGINNFEFSRQIKIGHAYLTPISTHQNSVSLALKTASTTLDSRNDFGVATPATASNDLTLVYSNTDPIFAKAIEGFRIYADIPIKSKWIDQIELKTKLQLVASNKSVPDIVIAAADILSIHQRINASEVTKNLISSTPLIESDVFMSLRSEDGKLYGLPIAKGNHLVLYYNKKLSIIV